jgi:hypothetical protein
MPIQSNLFNSGTATVSVAFNRGPLVTISGIAPPLFAPAPGYPAPAWDEGGPSPGNLGPGPNAIVLQTSGVVLPPLSVTVPNVSPGSIQTYLVWSYDKKTGAAKLGIAVLDTGQLIAVGTAP